MNADFTDFFVIQNVLELHRETGCNLHNTIRVHPCNPCTEFFGRDNVQE